MLPRATPAIPNIDVMGWSRPASVTGGGWLNTATGSFSSIGGGSQNSAGGLDLVLVRSISPNGVLGIADVPEQIQRDRLHARSVCLVELFERLQVSGTATFEKLVLPLRGGRRGFRLAQPDLLLKGEVKQIAVPGPG